MNAQLALALNTAGFVLLEVGLLRVLAVASWYHFAFMAISVALLGGGVGPLLLARRDWTPAQARRRLAQVTLALPAVAVAAYLAFTQVPFEPFRLGADGAQWLFVPLAIVLLAAPFLLSGLVTALVFIAAPAPAHRLYFVDLLGAAAGALLFAPVVASVGPFGLVLVAAALYAGAAALLAPRRRPRAGAAGVAALALVLAAILPDVAPRVSSTKRFGDVPVGEVLANERATVFTGFDALARVDVVRTRDGFRLLFDAGTAVTRLLTPHVIRRAPSAIAAVLAEARPASALVLGAGGGVEVFEALEAGATRVTAVELNPLVVELVTSEPFAAVIGNVFADERVETVVDEARSFLLQDPDRRWDAIVSAHTISNAALASGGLALAESYTLTVEAFADYQAHLAPRGLLVMTRPAGQLERLWRTAAAAWPVAADAAFADHALAFAGADRFTGVLIVGRAPLSAERRASLVAAFAARGLEPGRGTPGPRALLTPTTDDRPFFNQRVALTDLTLDDFAAAFEGDARLGLEDRPVAEVTLVLLLAQLLALGLLVFGLPLALARRGGRERPPLRAGLYFFLLGLAFLFVEMSLIQQLTLYLGQPTLAFAVVLAAVLVFAGLGSLTDARWAPSGPLRPTARAVHLLALPLVLVATAVALPPIMSATLGLPFAVRAAAAVALVAPSAFLMGRPFSRGLRWAAGRPPHLAWAFALNGLASVLASLLAVMLGMTLGLRAVILVAAALYLVAAPLLPRLSPSDAASAPGDRGRQT